MGDVAMTSSHRGGGGGVDASPELRILTRLGLAQLAIADQLVLLLKRFRAAQLRDLEDTLRALPDGIITHIQAHFDRKLDVKDELERYVQDLLKATHLARHLQLESDTQREVATLMGALGDGGDRALLLKMLQALGPKLARVLCAFCLQLPHIKLQQDFYRVFAVSDSGMGELKAWVQWLDSVNTYRAVVTEFFIKCTMERCLAQWLKLLHPVASPQRVAVMERLKKADAQLLKQISRFHDVTSLPVTKLLDLCATFHTEMAMLLAEFPMATTLTLYTKFNDDRLIATVIKAIYLLGKEETIRLVDALAVEDNLRAIQVFFIAIAEYDRSRAVAFLYLSLSKPSQCRLLDITLRAASGCAGDGVEMDPSIVFQFLLDGELRSIDDVLRKLASMAPDRTTMVTDAMRRYTADELVLVGEGVEAISDPRCIDVFLRLFDILLPAQRSMLVDWVHDMPGDEAFPLYDKLFELHDSAQLDQIASLLQMMSSLKKSDKIALCFRLLLLPSNEDEKISITAANEDVLKYLCNCDPSRRHKVVTLLDATDHASYGTLLFLLRTQRAPEQVALTKIMLSLSPDANGRLLTKLQGLDGETLDEFFQLFMLIPKVEYKMLARLLVSPEVSVKRLEDFVHVAANMMNQAASREIVIFTSELPPRFRNMFFELLAQCTPAEKGVVMRIVACSTRLPPEVLQLFVELLLRMPWETRSALVEQLRSLEESGDIQTYVLVLRGFDEHACLPRMVHLLNLLPLPVRVALVPLFARVESIRERTQALAKLNAMRKDRMPPYCATLCDPRCLNVISCNYLRVFGYLQDEYQAGMLQLLQWRSCWVFIEVLAGTMDVVIAEVGDEDCVSANAALVNGLAASLTMLKEEDDYALFGDVMEEALENGTRLEELIVVFAHFRDRERLIGLLKYVAHLTRYARSTLFFRVLSRSQATAFLFDMCHVLDLDDALFALKRLDRMRSRDPNGVDRMLAEMALRGTAVSLRDEFCHLVLGYHERAPLRSATPPCTVDRVILPREESVQACQSNSRLGESHSWSSESETVDDTDDALMLPPTSLRPLVVNKQLERVQDKREDARRRRRYGNWRKWTQADWMAIAARCEEASASGEASDVPACEEALPPQHCDDAAELTSACLEATSLATAGVCVSQSFEIEEGLRAIKITTDDIPDDQYCCQPSRAILPPIPRHGSPADTSTRPSSGHNNRPVATSSNAYQPTRGLLSRSESAPATLDQSNVAHIKRQRGLHAALGLDDVDNHSAPRDRGASIFHSQCVHVISNGPSRIRVARTEAAHTKILAARVDHALGRRAHAGSPLLPTRTSLQRSERHTIEQAALAIAHSKLTRSQAAQEFIKRGSG